MHRKQSHSRNPRHAGRSQLPPKIGHQWRGGAVITQDAQRQGRTIRGESWEECLAGARLTTTQAGPVGPSTTTAISPGCSSSCKKGSSQVKGTIWKDTIDDAAAAHQDFQALSPNHRLAAGGKFVTQK